MKKKKIVLAILCIIVLGSIILYASKKAGSKDVTAYGAVEEFYETSYQKYLNNHGFNGTMASGEVKVNLEDYKASEDMTASFYDNGAATGERGTITWSFEVLEAGFYNILVSYLPLAGTGSQIKRVLYIDGSILYSGMNQIVFNRKFTDESTEIAVKNNNEIRPKSIELFEEQTVYIDDSQKRSSEPYKIYLEKGQHTISFESIKEPMMILSITFNSMQPLKTYDEVITDLKSRYNTYSGENIICQAERADDNTTSVIRSTSSINVKNNVSDPNLMPYHPYNVVYNTIGGETWKYSGETITWNIEAPEEGLYKIAVKGRQSISRGITSYRRIRINGEIPFEEAQYLRFDYSTNMRNYCLGDGTEEGEYLFYLKKGENTISLEVVLGAFGETYTQISESVFILNELYRKVVQITGTSPDKYIDYEIVAKIPDITATLAEEQERLNSVLESLLEITNEKGENANLIEKMVVRLGILVNEPERMALSGELSAFKSNITSLATWLIKISEMPLEVDYITLYSAEQEPVKVEAGFFKKLYYNSIRFLATFFVDSTKVYTEDNVEKNSIKVWIPAGRDQAQVLRNLIDETFTPVYDIGVDLELVPIDVVLPSTLAGIGPDVVLSIDQTKMMDFAIRNALVDLSSLEGYEEISRLYYEGALEGVTYQEKVYGLPETQTFGMMFYRKDILDSLGLEPPKTWEEYKKIIPILQMNNYDAHMPGTAVFPTMIFQRGGDLYYGTGKDYGIKSGLSDKISMTAFKELTEFFTAYKIPYPVDFPNRFRTGEIPIGITDYVEYNKFELLAPEIKGLWSFELIPGTLKEDGTIDHTVACSTTQCVMLKAAQEKDIVDEAWIFMKWWMSTETQVAYANAIESILGSSARYASANKEVIKKLPWSTADAEKIIEQLEHTRGILQVPGHYMTTRMIEYTFKNVLAKGANPRETLYLNIKEIDIELTKKRREFGLSITE